MKKRIKVGFDFDGVIAYNPFRFARLPVSLLGKAVGKKDNVVTYFPKTPLEQWFWVVFHETSFFPSLGVDLLKKMLEKNEADYYLLTSRYAFLEKPLFSWLKKNNLHRSFKGYFINKQNEQPHKFKAQILKELQLDYYIDDNWGIVDYLNEQKRVKPLGFKTEIHWVTNFLERNKVYQYKHTNLKTFLDHVSRAGKK